MPLILVVDDDWMNREVMEAHLQAADYDVMVAHSGESALEMAFRRPPDLILLDARMQGISGYEVCERLKSHEATRYTPVVIVTALEDDTEKLKAIRSGADDFLPKPYSSLTMLTRVKSLLRVKQLQDELEARNDQLGHILQRYVSVEVARMILADLGVDLALDTDA
jgi:two-component system cell cycle response regulator